MAEGLLALVFKFESKLYITVLFHIPLSVPISDVEIT